jgi:importin subunit beta-1
MTLLLQDLQSSVLHRDVKPHILSAFGDIALSIGGKFENYLAITMTVLQQASQMKAEEHDEELQDYVDQLREGVEEAYTGIIQALKADGKQDLLGPHVESITSFLRVVTLDQNKSELVLRGGVGLLGDLAHSIGGHLKNSLKADWVEALLKQGRSPKNNSNTKEVTKWAQAVKRFL